MRQLKQLAILLAVVVSFCACEDEVAVQEKYRFSVETMPVRKTIKQDETTEIRCELIKEGDYENAFYTIRYFQPDGQGVLTDQDGTVFLPNDRYPLKRDLFRLYYTSKSETQQTIDITIEDNFKQRYDFSFRFNAETEKESNLLD